MLTLLLVLVACGAAPATPPAPAPVGPACGMSPSDWCPSPAGDPCGAHRDTESCRADPACEGMTYRGESVAACQWDDRCFAGNCPTVGCVTARCAAGDAKCRSEHPCGR